MASLTPDLCNPTCLVEHEGIGIIVDPQRDVIGGGVENVPTGSQT